MGPSYLKRNHGALDDKAQTPEGNLANLTTSMSGIKRRHGPRIAKGVRQLYLQSIAVQLAWPRQSLLARPVGRSRYIKIPFLIFALAPGRSPR